MTFVSQRMEKTVPSKLDNNPVIRKGNKLLVKLFQCQSQPIPLDEHVGRAYTQTDLSTYPTMGKYFYAIRCIGGSPHGFCWIDIEEDGGAYGPTVTVLTLEQALDRKLTLYSTPEKRAHLEAQGFAEIELLVHGGFNMYRYNAPSGPLSLEHIARRGANFYAKHQQRLIFNRVWFFHSLDSADDVNQLLGYPTGYGRVRWLAQLWPNFTIDQGSLATD